MRGFCRVCGQRTVGEEEIFAIGALLGDTHGDAQHVEDRLPPLGKQVLERYTLRVVNKAELLAWCDSTSTRKAFDVDENMLI